MNGQLSIIDYSNNITVNNLMLKIIRFNMDKIIYISIYREIHPCQINTLFHLNLTSSYNDLIIPFNMN